MARLLIGVLEPGVELLFRPDKNVERLPDLWIAMRLRYGHIAHPHCRPA